MQSTERQSLSALYAYPPITDEQKKQLFSDYTRITGRNVWKSMVKMLYTAWRLHGPRTAALIEELYGEFGPVNLLRRVIETPTEGERQDELALLTRTSAENPVRPWLLGEVDEVIAMARAAERDGDHALRPEHYQDRP